MDGQQRRWLINKDSEVLGPMTQKELVDGVVRGEFDIKMEAKLPGGGWKHLRLHGDLVSALREAGVPLNVEEDSSTSSTAHFTQSTTVQNATMTEPTGDLLEEDFPEVTVVQGSLKTTPPPENPPRIYEWTGAPPSRPERYGGYTIWLVVLLLGILGGWAALQYKSTGTSPLAGENQVRELTVKADSLRERGNFQEALWHYRKALEIEPLDAEIQRRMIPLLLREEHQSVQAERLIYDLKLSLTRPEDLKELYNLKGLSELYAGKWIEARASLEESVAIDSLFAPALWNRAMASFMAGEYSFAITDFGSLKASFPEAAQFFQQWSYYSAGLMDRVDMQALLETRGFALQQESYFLGLWMNTKLGATELASAFADKFLSADMDLSKLHFWDPSLYLQPVQWERLLAYCQDLEGSLEPKWREEAILGVCHLKAGVSATAQQYFEKSLSRQQNPLVQTLLAKVYFDRGEIDRAQLLLAESTAAEDLRHLLALRIMMLERRAGEMGEPLERLTDERFSLQKEYLQAWVALQQGAKDKAKYHWRRAQSRSPRFYPLKQLQMEIYGE